jgi:hypothetical protein
MEIIEITTLIDITYTGINRLNQGSKIQLDQQRNFNTLIQCLELRSIINYQLPPVSEKIDIKNLNFGSIFKGKHNVWTFRFSPDRTGAYFNEEYGLVGELINDINEVPIIKNLTETINIDKAIFNLTDSVNKNTLIKAYTGKI